jgi:hypothetical protein
VDQRCDCSSALPSPWDWHRDDESGNKILKIPKDTDRWPILCLWCEAVLPVARFQRATKKCSRDVPRHWQMVSKSPRMTDQGCETQQVEELSHAQLASLIIRYLGGVKWISDTCSRSRSAILAVCYGFHNRWLNSPQEIPVGVFGLLPELHSFWRSSFLLCGPESKAEAPSTKRGRIPAC